MFAKLASVLGSPAGYCFTGLYARSLMAVEVLARQTLCLRSARNRHRDEAAWECEPKSRFARIGPSATHRARSISRGARAAWSDSSFMPNRRVSNRVVGSWKSSKSCSHELRIMPGQIGEHWPTPQRSHVKERPSPLAFRQPACELSIRFAVLEQARWKRRGAQG